MNITTVLVEIQRISTLPVSERQGALALLQKQISSSAQKHRFDQKKRNLARQRAGLQWDPSESPGPCDRLITDSEARQALHTLAERRAGIVWAPR